MEDIREELKTEEKNIFVLAGAGTGKTTSMVERIAYSIENGVEPKNIVAISFTNNSTEDLREKVINKLNGLNKNIDEINISTIHSFCEKILKENSITAGISPNFKVLEDKEDTKRKNHIFNNYFKKVISNNEVFAWLVNFVNSKTIHDNISEIYTKTTSYLDINSFYGLNENIDEYNNPDLENLAKDLLQEISRIEQDLVRISNQNRKQKAIHNEPEYIYKKLGKELFNNNPHEGKIDLFKLSMDKLDDISEIYKSSRFEFSQECPTRNDEFNSCLENLKEIFNKFSSQIKERKNKIYYKFAVDAYKFYKEEIEKDKDFVNNDQLLFLTNKLLDNKKVCENLHNKYRHIYIDEYQDTDHIQTEIMFKLLTKEDGSYYDNKVYLVGDPKQSIYRFRGAEPDVYYDTKDKFAEKESTGQTTIKSIDTNYRSNNLIIDWFNALYSKKDAENNYLLPLTSKEEYIAAKCSDKNVIDRNDLKEKELAGVYVFDPSNLIDENFKYENSIVNLVKYLKQNYIRDKDTKEFRQVEYRDIMLLIFEHAKMAPYVKAFNDAKIPLRIEGEFAFYEEMAIKAFVYLYEAVNTKGKKSIEMGKETLRIILGDSYFNDNLTFREQDKKLFEIFAGLKKELKGLSSYGKALYLASRLDLLIVNGEKKDKFECDKIKSKLHQMIEEVFSQKYANGEIASRLFREYIDEKVEREALLEPNENIDCVRFLNLHKAKGLDSPIVIWIDLYSKKTKCFYYKNKYFYNKNVLSEEDSKIKELEKDDELERHRLEYVAATRAREVQIFTINPQENSDIFFNKEAYGIKNLTSIKITIEEQNDSDVSNDSKPIKYEKSKYSYNTSNENELTIDSPSKHEEKSKTKNEMNKAGMDGTLLRKDEYKRPANNIIGTIIHRAFELMIKNKENVDCINISVNQALNESSADIEKCTSSDDSVNKYEDYKNFCLCATKALYEYFKENGIFDKELYPELKFSYKKDENLILNGSIDLLCVENENATIIDYKSDTFVWNIDEDTKHTILKEKYQNQLNEYESTIKTLMPHIKNIKKKIIYFTGYDAKEGKVDVKEFEL